MPHPLTTLLSKAYDSFTNPTPLPSLRSGGPSYGETLPNRMAPEHQFVDNLLTKIGMNPNDKQGLAMLFGLAQPGMVPGTSGSQAGLSMKFEKNRRKLADDLVEHLVELGGVSKSGFNNPKPREVGPNRIVDAAIGFLRNKYPKITGRVPLANARDVPGSSSMGGVLGYYTRDSMEPMAVITSLQQPGTNAKNMISSFVNTGAHELVHGLSDKGIVRNSKFPILGQSGGRESRDYITATRGKDELPIAELVKRTNPSLEWGTPEFEHAVELAKLFRLQAYRNQPEETIANRGGDTAQKTFRKVVQQLYDDRTTGQPEIDLRGQLTPEHPTYKLLDNQGLLPNAGILSELAATGTARNLEEYIGAMQLMRNIRKHNLPFKSVRTSDQVLHRQTPYDVLWEEVNRRFRNYTGQQGQFPK